MASISRVRSGNRRILFSGPGGARRTIYLGRMPKRDAEEILRRVEALVASKFSGRAVEVDTAAWVANLPETLARKLARVGLIDSPEAKTKATLEAFIESYIARRNDVSPHTRRIWRQTLRLLSAHFGARKPLAEITRGDAADWRLSLVAQEMADATVRKHCGFAKHFFARAVDHELITTNPFAKLISAPVGNAARQYFVTREETTKILDAAPDAQWRLIIALSRYGGLRCPSEHLALRWGDIDWERGRMTVRSPKTARHVGHESRVVPLFPELRPYLEAVFDEADPGTEAVITRYRHDSNMRTQLRRIVERAGLKPWPRITHNLRASRATELAAEHPAHVAAAWLGHSTLVAQKHYWTVTDSDFERAAGTESNAESDARGAHPTRKTTQHVRERKRTLSQPPSATQGELVGCAAACELAQNDAFFSTEVHGNRTHLRHGSRAARRF